MNKFCFTVVIACYCQLSLAQKVFLASSGHLKTVKEADAGGNAEVKNAVELIVNKADGLLSARAESVMDKTLIPPGGSKHDYMSLAPYFWPDPSQPNGIPYLRKDGERNPDVKKITDATYLNHLADRCKLLSLAYYFTGDEKYALKASQLLAIWFLAPDTKMNPNLNYAQAIRGVNDGRGIGIIESRCLVELADWIGLLEGSKSFTANEAVEIKRWYKQYLNWMLASKNGKDEQLSKNNHGTIYDMQVASFALFTGDQVLAQKVLTESLKRITVQIEPDGKQPLELERTRAYSYSTMNLDGWFNLALLGDHAGVDIWGYKTADGRNIREALNWVIPYVLEGKKGDYQQISSDNKDELYKLLLLAGHKYQDKAYLEKAALIAKDAEIKITDLIY